MTEALQMALFTIMQPLAWITQMFYHANALPIYIALFLVYTVLRLIVRPIIGEGISEGRKEIKSLGKENYKKVRGGNKDG